MRNLPEAQICIHAQCVLPRCSPGHCWYTLASLPLIWFLVPVSRVSLIYLNPCISNMASVSFVGTLESDDDVDQLDNESDSDEEPKKVCRH